MGSKVQHSESAEECESCCQWCLWPPSKSITNKARKLSQRVIWKSKWVEIIRGFVVKITFFKHPLFRALLDPARDQFDDSSTPTKLWFPGDETVYMELKLNGSFITDLGEWGLFHKSNKTI